MNLVSKVKHTIGSRAFGLLMTAPPLVFAVPFYDRGWFRSMAGVCDWPMLWVQHHVNVRGNELNRMIILLVVNILTWAILTESAYLLLGLVKKTAFRNSNGD